jgi:hypothetical protein
MPFLQQGSGIRPLTAVAGLTGGALLLDGETNGLEVDCTVASGYTSTPAKT